MAITQKQVSDWFKLNPNATPEQVAQLVQSIGGLSANPGLANLIGNQYGMSGLNIGSVYGNITSNTAGSISALEDYVKKNGPIPSDPFKSDEYVVISRQLGVDPAVTKKFADQYSFATSSQVRDVFADPRTRSADITARLIEKGISPETLARYIGITPERASQIYTNSIKDNPKLYSGDLGAVIPKGLMQATTAGGTTTTDTAGTKQVVTDTNQVATVANTRENIDKLQSQILAQNTTAKWSGGLPTDKTALYMAADLDKSGITDISQVGQSDKGIINKLTGEKLFSGYGERTKGNLWSGSYEGSGNTGFGVQFTDSGKPIFYSEGASSSTLKKDLLKAALLAGAAFGLAGPESLAGIFD